MKGRSNREAVAHTQQDPTSTACDSAPVVVHQPDLTDALPLQTPRLLSRQQAAAYCGVGLETFDDYRRRGIVPGPISGTNRWDRKLIDMWLDKASGLEANTETSLDEWRAHRNG